MTQVAPDWTAQLKGLPAEAAIDLVYDWADPLVLSGSAEALEALDRSLTHLDPAQLNVQVVIAVLIATLPAATHLKERAGFVERRLPYLTPVGVHSDYLLYP